MRKNLLAALAILTLVASQAPAQNLVENPSFEDPTVDMGAAEDVWFRFGSGANGTSSESTVMPRSGSRHIALQLIGTNQFAGVFQNLNIPVSPGQTATFTGWAKNALSTPFNATQEIKLEWQGAAANQLNVLTLGSDYSQFSHSGVAPAGTTGLVVTYAIANFGPGQGDALVYLDDVSLTLTPIPEPATAAMLGLGALGMIRIARRRRK